MLKLDLFTRRESVKDIEESGGFYNFWDATRGLATIDAELKECASNHEDRRFEQRSKLKHSSYITE